MSGTVHATRLAARRPDRIAAAAAGVVTAVLVLVELQHGVPLGPDAWTYWSTSVSLLEGEGYVDAHGLPVLGWPPLYSLWLAAVQAVTGVSIKGALVADALAVGLAAALFTLWALGRTDVRGSGPRWPVAALVTAMLLVQTRGIAAHYVMLALLGGLLLALDGARRADSHRRTAGALLLAAVLAAGMVLTRHAALALVGAAAVAALATARRRPAARLVAAATLGGAGILAFWSARVVLGQVGSHGMWNSTSELGATAWTMLTHVGRGLGPFPVGIAAFVLVGWLVGHARPGTAPARDLRDVSAQADVVLFVALGLGATLAMFLLVHVADPPNERFVGFASLTFGALGAGLARHVPSRGWRWVALAVLLLPSVARAGKHVVLGRTGANTVDAHGGESFLPLNATLDRTRPPDAVRKDGRVVVAPPLFAWDAARLRRGEGRGSGVPPVDPADDRRGR